VEETSAEPQAYLDHIVYRWGFTSLLGRQGMGPVATTLPERELRSWHGELENHVSMDRSLARSPSWSASRVRLGDRYALILRKASTHAGNRDGNDAHVLLDPQRAVEPHVMLAAVWLHGRDERGVAHPAPVLETVGQGERLYGVQVRPDAYDLRSHESIRASARRDTPLLEIVLAAVLRHPDMTYTLCAEDVGDDIVPLLWGVFDLAMGIASGTWTFSTYETSDSVIKPRFVLVPRWPSAPPSRDRIRIDTAEEPPAGADVFREAAAVLVDLYLTRSWPVANALLDKVEAGMRDVDDPVERAWFVAELERGATSLEHRVPTVPDAHHRTPVTRNDDTGAPTVVAPALDTDAFPPKPPNRWVDDAGHPRGGVVYKDGENDPHDTEAGFEDHPEVDVPAVRHPERQPHSGARGPVTVHSPGAESEAMFGYRPPATSHDRPPPDSGPVSPPRPPGPPPLTVPPPPTSRRGTFLAPVWFEHGATAEGFECMVAAADELERTAGRASTAFTLALEQVDAASLAAAVMLVEPRLLWHTLDRLDTVLIGLDQGGWRSSRATKAAVAGFAKLLTRFETAVDAVHECGFDAMAARQMLRRMTRITIQAPRIADFGTELARTVWRMDTPRDSWLNHQKGLSQEVWGSRYEKEFIAEYGRLALGSAKLLPKKADPLP